MDGWIFSLIAVFGLSVAVQAQDPAERVAVTVQVAEPPPVVTEPDPWPDIAGTPSDATWSLIAECESGGDWSIATGNGYYGGVQFALGSWRAVGGQGYPHEASQDEQIFRADLLWQEQGWPAWPACSRAIGLR